MTTTAVDAFSTDGIVADRTGLAVAEGSLDITFIGVTSYGALGHVPPLELGHVKKIWQFLR